MTHLAKPPFACSSGPKVTSIALVGEAFGRSEALLERPFIGASGQELTRMLTQAGIKREDCFLTNVFAFQPESNNIETLCVAKKELPPGYKLPAIKQGKYIKPEFLPEVERLKQELVSVAPNIVIALGNVAAWALLQQTAISRIRGYCTFGPLLPSTKILPTFHPAAVLRDWSARVIVVADFFKAKRESEFPEIRRRRRAILVDPTLQEIYEWINKAPIHQLGVDIETKARMIEMVGFARSAEDAIAIPFIDKRKPEGSYWVTADEERSAWYYVQHLLDLPCPKIFQNGMYDLQYLARQGLRVRNCSEDTMLLHHSLFPEMQKSLGFMGSTHTSEPNWKLMRGKEAEELKRDE